MNCDELRQRIVDPGSAATGGHAPVVAHLQSCAECRSLARTFADVERLFGASEKAVPPDDLDERVRQRLGRAPAGRLGLLLDRRFLAAAAAGILVVTAAYLLRPRGTPASAPPPPREARSSSAPPGPTEAPPPDILAVRSAPIALAGTPVPEEEKARALALRPREYLEFLAALSFLDPFFPETPSAGAPNAIRPPTSPEEIAQRIAEWEEAGASGRERWLGLDAAYGATDAARRSSLETRWNALSGFSPDERAGLRRLAARIAELDEKRRSRLVAEIRAIANAPRAERPWRWRASPFARTLTGQEVASGERLLLFF